MFEFEEVPFDDSESNTDQALFYFRRFRDQQLMENLDEFPNILNNKELTAYLETTYLLDSDRHN